LPGSICFQDPANDLGLDGIDRKQTAYQFPAIVEAPN
jgi:hypothetical protein